MGPWRVVYRRVFRLARMFICFGRNFRTGLYSGHGSRSTVGISKVGARRETGLRRQRSSERKATVSLQTRRWLRSRKEGRQKAVRIDTIRYPTTVVWEKECAEANYVQVDDMPSTSKSASRFIMCLMKRKPGKPTKPGNVTITVPSKSSLDLRPPWSSRNSCRVNQHDSSSSLELVSTSTIVFTPNHSKESQVSNSSVASKGSLTGLKEVVGDGAIVYQYKELRRATESFSASRRLGNSVYQGTVRGGMDVAISIHKKGDMYTDLVPKLKTLCSVHHSNVVSMVGACTTEVGDYVYAVYEFIEGAKLRDCLRSVHSPGYCVLNTWIKRLQVAVDVAKGLEYLHEGTHVPLVHKYIKSNNILVDKDTLRAKIAQFGLADLAGEVPPVLSVSRRNSTSTIMSSSEITEISEDLASPSTPTTPRPKLVRSRSKKLTGTRGYMAPEYMKTGAVTSKSDVFAFGVVLLELLSGQEAIIYRPDPVSGTNALKRFTLREAIQAIFDDKEPRARLRMWMDPLLKDSYPLSLALKTALLAKSCLDSDPNLRPEMRSVALDLVRIMIASEKWEASMLASKNMMSRTMEAR